MSHNIDPDALASALPVGITLEPGSWWDTQRIAEFQAERLAKAGYRLVHEEHGDSAEAQPEKAEKDFIAHAADMRRAIQAERLADLQQSAADLRRAIYGEASS